MELGEYLAVLRKRWFVIVVLAALGGAIGYAQAATGTPVYRSTSSVYLTPTRGDTVSEFVQGANYTQNLVQSYVQIATTPRVLDPVVDELGLETTGRALAKRVTADSPLNTMIIEISAVSFDPQASADIANAAADSLAETVGDLSPTYADGGASLQLTVLAEAVAPRAPFAPRPRLDGAVGVALGTLLGVLFALAVAQLDTRVRTAKDLPTSPARATLGQIPYASSLGRHPRALLEDPHSPLAESYRRLRTNLQFLDVSRKLRCFVVTSSVPGEGKSTTSVNLALIVAEKGVRVLLVDADLRSPSIASICGLEGAAGLSAVLIHEADIEDVAQPWGARGLHVIAAGQVPPNPSQLIDSDAMDEFLQRAGELYDLVILDTAPMLAVTDAAVLARRTDGALVVARSRKVKRPDLVEALASLDTVGATCLGLLVNGVPTSRSDTRYGYGRAPARRTSPFRRVSARPAPKVAAWIEPAGEPASTPAWDLVVPPSSSATHAAAAEVSVAVEAQVPEQATGSEHEHIEVQDAALTQLSEESRLASRGAASGD